MAEGTARVVHAGFSAGRLHLWCEDAARFAAHAPASMGTPAPPRPHPFAAPDPWAGLPLAASADPGSLRIALPSREGVPLPSSSLALTLGLPPDEEPGASVSVFEVPTRPIDSGDVLGVVAAIVEAIQVAGLETGLIAGASLRYFAAAASLARHLLAQQRFIPSLVQAPGGELKGEWQAWVSDAASAERVTRLVAAMPPAARAAADELAHDPWSITEAFLNSVIDAESRRELVRDSFADALDGRDPAQDPHVAWLAGLLGPARDVPVPQVSRQDLVRRVRNWIGVLEERGTSSVWRLLMRLREPIVPPTVGDAGEDVEWAITFHVQSVENPSIVVDAPDIWVLSGDSVTMMGRRLDRPHELLLGELGRASRFYRRLENALEDGKPQELTLTTKQAYEFLREYRPILMEQGFAVEAPEWWDSPSARLGARLRLESEGPDPMAALSGGMTLAARTQVGLGTLVNYTWEIAVGDTTLTLQEFEQLAAKRTPLVRLNGRWIEVRPEDVQAAIRFIRENPGGKVKLGEAMRMAFGMTVQESGIPIVGLEARGWFQAFLNSELGSKALKPLEPPKTFHGTLRPYQARGLSWLVFQQQLGFGVCLADDMGLGKTIQLLALLAYEREPLPAEEGAPQPTPSPAVPDAGSTAVALKVPPTLLLVPMSVVGNWVHETRRFCPDLRVLVHHGMDRLQGDPFLARTAESDLVITTYALAHRDRDLLKAVPWHRIVLDEAQYIKNPSAKQSQAARSLEAACRVALTGTPVENRLTELWSIMDFLNPGYLGSSGSFRTRFGVPIERYHDKQRAEQLRGLIRPFVLRRLKSDPTVVADLPEKVESKEYAHLTTEQASLYESCVRRMLREVDEAEGMQRRGLVLSASVRLKQICNHPSQILKDMEGKLTPADPSRSGKCVRLLEMLEELVSEGEQALVFTQFREMGALLEGMMRHRLGKDVLFVHGGTTQPQRQAMIDRFQKADGTAPVLLLSLRAGGVGLNLTAATHVFHFDRWWNPAVENQATDRAYRIGQTRTVQVHKFIVGGTLEERIDQMIESKTELAENIIGSGENWLTELNTEQLRDILTLRNEAVEDEV